MYKDNMACRLCKSVENKTQEHMERCEFTKERRENIDMGKELDKIVLLRNLPRELRKLYNNKDANKDLNKTIMNMK